MGTTILEQIMQKHLVDFSFSVGLHLRVDGFGALDTFSLTLAKMLDSRELLCSVQNLVKRPLDIHWSWDLTNRVYLPLLA